MQTRKTLRHDILVELADISHPTGARVQTRFHLQALDIHGSPEISNSPDPPCHELRSRTQRPPISEKKRLEMDVKE
ncbi:hypothetical protein AKJ16_DCAP22549 [Drosera capensis]